MGSSLLRQLLSIVRSLLLKSKGIITPPFTKVLRLLGLIWSFHYRRFQTGRKKSGNDDPTTRTPPEYDATFNETRNESSTKSADDDLEMKTLAMTPASEPGTREPTQQIITLDSSISCSLHPHPYIHDDKSRSSLHLARRSRQTHSLAISNASRSTHHFSAAPSLNPSITRTQSDEAEDDGGYTFTLQSPHYSTSPLSRNPRSPRRGYSMSSPDLGSSNAGHHYINVIDFGKRDTRTTTSPAGSRATGDLPSEMGRREYDHLDEHRQRGLFNPRIYPNPPSVFSRYWTHHIAKKVQTKMTIPPMEQEFADHEDPPGWTSVVHHEGVLYFYNAEKHAVTEANLYNHTYYKQIMEDLAVFDEFIRDRRITMPTNYTLALDLTEDKEKGLVTDYYFADHDRRIIFFFDDWHAENFLKWADVPGVTSRRQVRYLFEEEYWYHCMLFPSTMTGIRQAAHEMRDYILHYIGDVTSSMYATSPYELDELYRLLEADGEYTVGVAELISRIMQVFVQQRFYHWHGLPQRRVYRDLSVYGPKSKRTWLIKLLSPPLFSAPDVHLYNLEKMWVDEIMHNAVWVQSIKKLNDEWQEFILYATVLLNANVAFLAIESIDTDTDTPYRSPVQVGCYLSIVASIGSIIIGLLLVRQHRTRAHSTADEVSNFLKQRSHPTLGLETLAILYSLPYALLLWGMFSFLAAFAWNCFDLTNAATRTIMGIAWVLFTGMVIWCVWMGWAGHPPSDTGPYEVETQELCPSKEPSVVDVIAGALGRRSHESIETIPDGNNASPLTIDAHVAGGREQEAGKWKWSWSPLLFWNSRRPSYHSEKTVV
ncbi:hypothetical protein CC1G_07674 [Coprinopsis cinerea okayama7|uniref:WW domain-containing protein n=1 Tax=Coprinopsis cinerea (strain Okayama-7 / 130 / ATCC MYA-4618 / FGSC 9003) TaxID=240176 RepID=A8NC70_COPC7|nr:hypothetical protein CC1G_07674 [Coprinopsis cinerea okayama7\|eukprot:XP_001832414.2 hypothetical protein CC1G_07674 [Coprinopsis cinerea okayama7\